MNKQPPAPGFMPPPPYTTTEVPPPQPSVVVVQQATAFGTSTQHMTCPHCGANMSTRIESEANTKTHLFALLLCVFGLWCCAPCPYCMDSCLVTKHYCPACKSYLGQSDN